jgi:hypothetical protein
LVTYLTCNDQSERDALIGKYQTIATDAGPLFELLAKFSADYADALDIMTLVSKMSRYTPRELNTAFKDTRNEAGMRMRRFIESSSDTGKIYFNKFLVNKKTVTKNKTIYSENRCVIETSNVIEYIPLHRSTFQEQEFMTDKGDVFEAFNKYEGEKTKQQNNAFKNQFLYNNLESQPHFEFLERTMITLKNLPTETGIPEQARLGYMWGLLYDTETGLTYVAPKIYTDIDKPKENFCKVVVIKRSLRNIQAMANAYKKGETSPQWVEELKVVRHYKVPATKKEMDENSLTKMLSTFLLSATAETAKKELYNIFFKPLPQSSHDFLSTGRVGQIIKFFTDPVKTTLINAVNGKKDPLCQRLALVEALYDLMIVTKPFIPNPEENITRDNLSANITTAQIRLIDFMISSKLIVAPTIKNARKMIDWAGGSYKQVTVLTPDDTPKYELEEMASLL